MKSSEIEGRRVEGKKVIRVLDCGHEQEEPRGGKAKFATRARCKLCHPPKPQYHEGFTDGFLAGKVP